MATWCLYRSNNIVHPGGKPGYCAALARYIGAEYPGSGWYKNKVLDPEPDISFYSLAVTEPSIHATCRADPDITALSPERASAALLNTWLDGNLTAGQLSSAAIVESDGVPIDDLTTSNTRRELFRRICYRVEVGNRILEERGSRTLIALRNRLIQEYGAEQVASYYRDHKNVPVPAAVRGDIASFLTARGVPIESLTVNTTLAELVRYLKNEPTNNALQFLQQNLGSAVSSLTSTQRDRIQEWLEDHFIDTSWVVGSTTIRQILKYTFANGLLNPAKFEELGYF